MIRLVAADMDGTLLDSYRKITQKNVQAIELLQKNGIEFIVNTGREFENVRRIMKSVNIKCGKICSNGAAGYDEDNQLLFRHVIPKPEVKQILDILEAYDMVPTIFMEKGRVSILPLSEQKNHIENVMVPAMRVSHPDYVYTDADYEDMISRTRFFDGKESVVNTNENVIKILSNTPHVDRLPPIREELKKIPNLAVSYTAPTDVEVTVNTAQKGIALMDYAKRKGYSADEILAIGDSDNDYSMLSVPGVQSVAMANAAKHIRDICIYHTRANTSDGIAYIIDCLLKDRENLDLR